MNSEFKPENKPGYKAHLFVCTNSPDKPNKCGSKGSEEMRKSLKEKCNQIYATDVRVNASGCLGYCEQGIAAVLYCEGQDPQWRLNLTSNDGDQLFKLVQTAIKRRQCPV